MRRALAAWARSGVCQRGGKAAESVVFAAARASSSTAQPEPEPSKGGVWFLQGLAASALGLGGVLGYTVLQEQSQKQDEDGKTGEASTLNSPVGSSWLDGARRRTFFKYEKRIRDMSPLEKVYAYFASEEKDGMRWMTVADLLPALIPVYAPESAHRVRNGNLPGEPDSRVEQNNVRKSMLNEFDTDGDDLISFSEFLLVQCLLGVRDHYIKTVFQCIDIDGSNTITLDEFKLILANLQGATKVNDSLSGQWGGMAHNMVTTTDPNADMSGLLTTFFGKNGKGEVTLDQFANFIVQLQEEIVQLEFEFYDWDCNGKISAIDFARCIVVALPIGEVDRYLDRADKLDEALLAQEFTLKEFHDFCMIRRKPYKLKTALQFFRDSRGQLTKEDFKFLVGKISKVDLNKHMVDIIYHMYADSKGDLQDEKFIKTMCKHVDPGVRRGVTQPDDH